MKCKSWLNRMAILATAVVFSLASSAYAGTFGKVVPIGGHAADLAIDEGRGVLYVANFTANRIEVMSLADHTIQRSINVAAQPSGIALSPDGRYLVAVHFGNFAAPQTPRNSLTVIDLTSDAKRTFALGNPPIGVAFGIDARALIVTTAEFILFDPVSGQTETLDTVSRVTAKTLPQPPATFPTTIKSASLGVSGDGLTIYGFGEGITFKYEVTQQRVVPGSYVSAVPIGPRVVSVNRDGSSYMAGWLQVDGAGRFSAFFQSRSGLLDVGTTVYDDSRGLMYAQIPEAGQTATSAPILKIVESDNLALREKIQLPENFAGKSVLSSDGNTMYGVSDSGIMVLPVGSLSQVSRVAAQEQDLVFRGNFCERTPGSQTLTIVDKSGASTPFSLTTTQAGVIISPSAGFTPATVRISVDPTAFIGQKGTVAASIKINSPRAVNVPDDVRVLVNSREPDQRGTFVNVSGELSDIISDPSRDRFYILRRNTNEVLVYDGATYQQIATMRTGNEPAHGAITFDRRYLLVGHDSSNIITVYDLETLQPSGNPIHARGGAPKSIAVSANAILANVVDAENKGHINRIDLQSRTAIEYPSLGVYENKELSPLTRLASSPNGSSIIIAQPDGNVILYSATADTFTISRKDATTLAGPVAASNYDQFVVGNRLLNASLVTVRQLETATGQSSGFVFVDRGAFRMNAPNASSPGILQRVDLESGEGVSPTRTIEAPRLSESVRPFTRTLAPLYSKSSIVALTTSGFTVLPWNYDAAVAPPRIERVVNAADQSQALAPGSLISIYGRDLSPINQASSQTPLPNALGESCLTVNGMAVPVLFVSNRQINAQLPFGVEGSTTLRLNTPGGVSDNLSLSIQPSAPSVFRTTNANQEYATVVRAANNLIVTPSNPIHRNEAITIYATGLGRTAPAVDAGTPSPYDPIAIAVNTPTVTIGGVPVEVIFAGLTPGQIGVYQINAIVHGSVPLGFNQDLVISSGSSTTTIPVRVVN